ncbi:MAG: phosphotransferase [Ilumatobacteraceae bacterium]
MSDLAEHLVRAGFPADTPTTRLAGLTNLNHLLAHEGRRYVLRIPGAGTSEYIDRTAEEVAARSAAAAGVNAEVVFFDSSDGLMVTRYVEGAVTMNSTRFRDLDAVARAGRALRVLHTTAAPFAIDFVLFPIIDDYKVLLASKGATLPDGYDDLEAQAEATRRALEAKPRPLVPSHCDPLCENFLDTGERMYVIDFEYSGNNDPMWDLGDLSVEGDFGPEQDAALLRAYFGGEPATADVARMIAYKAMCDVLWALWGLVQHVNGNPVEDFWAYATGRFDRCRALMSAPDYAARLDEVRAV